MTVVAMSRKEIDRMHVLRDLNAQRITINEAALLMRLTRRQVFRLVKHYRQVASSTQQPVFSIVTPVTECSCATEERVATKDGRDPPRRS
jgi:predicted DNA-binding protein (UPF0251 family)